MTRRDEPRPWGFVRFACGHAVTTTVPNWSMICRCSLPGPKHVTLLGPCR